MQIKITHKTKDGDIKIYDNMEQYGRSQIEWDVVDPNLGLTTDPEGWHNIPEDEKQAILDWFNNQ